MIRRISFGVSALTAFLVLCSSLMAGQDEVASLARQLPTNASVGGNTEFEQRIAAFGTAALPALVKELHLGIRFKTLNSLLQSEGSRRFAVVRVLVRIPGEESTDVLVRSLSDPPDCYGMTVAILEGLAKRALSKDQIVTLLGNQ